MGAPLTEHEGRAVAAFVAALADPDALLEAWTEQDLFQEIGNDGLLLRRAAGNSDAVAAVARRHQSATGRPLPVLLATVLAACNGYNVEETEGGTVTVEEVAAVEDVWNGFLRAEELESFETSDGRFSGVRFAVAYAQGSIVVVDEGPRAGVIVFDEGKGPAVILAADLAVFVTEVAAAGLSVEALVSRHLDV